MISSVDRSRYVHVARHELDNNVTLSIRAYLTYLAQVKDTNIWTVWLGWHAVENVSTAPKGWLKWVRNPL